MSHRLGYGQGAQVVRTVPQQGGRAVVVASADFAICNLRHPADDAEHEIESGSATVDPVSTTLAAPAGKGSADPRSIVVASATGIAAGRRYLLSSGGRSELVRVEAVDGTTLRLAATLGPYFASGSTLRGVELSATVPTGVTADDDFVGGQTLAVRWSPAGMLPWLEQIFLERVAPSPPITPEAVLELDPTLANYAGTGATVADALAMALEDFRVDLLIANLGDSDVLAGPIGQSAVKYRAAYHLLKHSSDESAVRRTEAYAKRYDELRAALLVGKDKAKVTHTDADSRARPLSIRSLFNAGGW